MKSHQLNFQRYAMLFATAVALSVSLAMADGEVPEELKTPNYRITRLEGIGYDQRFGRQDPSNVIKVGDTYHEFTVQWSADGIDFKRAARLKYVHTGCGPYDPDAFSNTTHGRGITWGVAQDQQQGKMCIVRFDVELEAPQNVPSNPSVDPHTNDINREDLDKAIATVEAAVPQARKDPTRPVYHFRPPAQWMNDICGVIRYKDCYHAFYQYNPFSGDRWGDDYTLWAHARSKDLVHWEDLPWAFLPMKDRGEQRCNSGCITLDGHGRPMIFYTFVPARPDATRLGKREHWGVVPLDDDLIRWRRVKDGPRMAAGMNGIPADTNAGWSDPFVFRCVGRTFVTFKSCNGLVCEAQDKELMQWKYAGHMDGVDGECPNFFALQGKSVLLRSTMPPTYVVGDFNPQTIQFDMNGPQGVLDHGFGSNPPKDRAWTRGLYATNVFVDKDQRRIMLGWVCGFKPSRGWNGCMSLPRVLTLDKDQRLVQTPVAELKKLRGRHVRVENLCLSSESRRIEGAQGDALEIVADFDSGNATAFGLKVRCSDDGQNAVTLRYADGILDIGGAEVPTASGKDGRTLKLRVFLDKSVMEVFINDGTASVTRVDYPGEQDLDVVAFSENGRATLKLLDIWQMKRIWK